MTPAHTEQTVQLFVLQMHACIRRSLSAGRPPQPSSPESQVVTGIVIRHHKSLTKWSRSIMWQHLLRTGIASVCPVVYLLREHGVVRLLSAHVDYTKAVL